MRWPAKVTRATGHRARTTFAWLPTRVDVFIVWLEHYGVEEAYVEEDLSGSCFADTTPAYWAEVRRWLI
jgi:hypothetical protein